MRLNTVSFFLFLCSCFFVNAQEFKLLEGRIAHSSLSLAGIHVVNTSRGTAQITDVDGRFEISVKQGETLFFSGIQFKQRKLIITQEIFSLDKITVYMEAYVNELDEVIVTPHQLSGNLRTDFNNSGLKPQINFKDVGIPGFVGERKEKIVPAKSLILNALLLPISGGIDIEAVYKHLSGYYKRLKKQRKVHAHFEQVFEIIKFYGPYFFVENYSLELEQVYEFVLGCSENSDIRHYFSINAHQEVVQAFDQYYTIQYEK